MTSDNRQNVRILVAWLLLSVLGYPLIFASGARAATSWMTGGGSVFTETGVRVTHGLELHCDANDQPNNWR
ncbi:MAG: hypothetical protein AUI33_14645 [Ignavibacteria bacterium 13_1_40CM_2_61_4]|nr:MAG: hypothetical protein AUI33_14645 [Ignavibacteria bacterium 13_1_40CM_2_61_4]